MRRVWHMRSLLLFLAALVLATGAVGCSGGGDDDGGSPAAAATTTSTTGEGEGEGETTGTGDELPDVGKKTIGFVGICVKCTGQARVVNALKEEADKLGWEVVVVDAAGDLNKANAGFTNLYQRGVDAVISGAIDPYLLDNAIKGANDRGIEFVVNDGDWRPGVTFAVAMNSFYMGMAQAQWMVERLNAEGNIVLFNVPNARNVAERYTVFKAIIEMFPNMKILEEHTVNFTDPIQDAQRTMSGWLQRYGDDVDAVWAAWDDPAIGAALAIDQAGKSDQVFVIGNDAGPDALERIKGDSALDGTVYVDYTLQGQLYIQELHRVFATGQPSAKWIWIKEPIVTRHVDSPVGGDVLWPVPESGDLERVVPYSFWAKAEESNGG